MPDMRRRAWLTGLASALLAPAASGRASAQGWPSRPLRLVVPTPPGGSVDAMARAVAAGLQPGLGQSVVVDNRPGAGGNLAAAEVARAPKDGHTVLLATVGTHAINAALFPSLPYDPVRDFAPVTMLGAVPNVLVLNIERARDYGIRGVPDLIRVARSRPGALNMASTGNGSSTHLSGELFKAMTGSYLLHIPYRGSSAALVDLVAGATDLMFDNIPSALPHIRSGRLLALAVTGARRSVALPELPTVEEAGGPDLTGYEATSWSGLCAPAGTPAEVVLRLQRETAQVLTAPPLRDQLAALGVMPGGMAPNAFAALIRSEVAKWASVVKFSGAKPS